MTKIYLPSIFSSMISIKTLYIFCSNIMALVNHTDDIRTPIFGVITLSVIADIAMAFKIPLK